MGDFTVDEVHLIQGWVSSSVTPKKSKKGKQGKKVKEPLGFYLRKEKSDG